MTTPHEVENLYGITLAELLSDIIAHIESTGESVDDVGDRIGVYATRELCELRSGSNVTASAGDLLDCFKRTLFW